MAAERDRIGLLLGIGMDQDATIIVESVGFQVIGSSAVMILILDEARHQPFQHRRCGA